MKLAVASLNGTHLPTGLDQIKDQSGSNKACTCLLYTSDAADERSSVDLGGRRIIKKKKKKSTKKKHNISETKWHTVDIDDEHALKQREVNNHEDEHAET